MMADKQKVSRLLKTARGQIDGILKMIDEDRYCIDISNQIMAFFHRRIRFLNAGIFACVLLLQKTGFSVLFMVSWICLPEPIPVKAKKRRQTALHHK